MFKKSTLLIAFFAILFTQRTHSKKFDEKIIEKIVHQSIELPELERLDFILKKLNIHYKTPTKVTYHLFNGGDAYGLVAILHASVTEYLLIYGSAISNGGHSGRYTVDIYDFIYRGKVTIAGPSNPEGTEFNPGQFTLLKFGQAKHYFLEKNTWMIEYAHGFTPTSLHFMLAGLASTGDIIGSGYLCYDYGKQVLKNLIKLKI